MRPASGRVDVDRFLRDAPALLRLLDKAQRAHVVQAVGELHQQHADIVRHRQHQLAEVFRLLGALAEEFELRQLRHAIDKAGDLLAEVLPDIFERDERIFDRVVQQRGDDRRRVELQVGEDGGDFERMCEIGIAGRAELLSVRLHCIDVGLVEQILVGVGIISFDPFDEHRLAHQLSAGLVFRHAFGHGGSRVNPTLLPGLGFAGTRRSAHCENIIQEF